MVTEAAVGRDVTAAAIPQRLITPMAVRSQASAPVYVHPGHVAVAGPPPHGASAFTTILGSCVAVCLHDPVTEIGGLNHFLLPVPTDDTEPSPRYAPTAIETLIQRLLAEGARKERLVAQLFGGASVLRAFTNDVNHLGRRNVTAALELLAAHRIRVKGSDTGGTHGRKLTFVPRDGSTTVHLIGR
jgi:chemotaxis protein CheD